MIGKRHKVMNPTDSIIIVKIINKLEFTSIFEIIYSFFGISRKLIGCCRFGLSLWFSMLQSVCRKFSLIRGFPLQVPLWGVLHIRGLVTQFWPFISPSAILFNYKKFKYTPKFFFLKSKLGDLKVQDINATSIYCYFQFGFNSFRFSYEKQWVVRVHWLMRFGYERCDVYSSLEYLW